MLITLLAIVQCRAPRAGLQKRLRRRHQHRSRRKPQWMGQTKEVARCQEEVLEEVEVVGIRERRCVDIIQ